MLESLDEAITHIDLEHNVKWINQRASQVLGLAPETVIGRKCHELWCKDPDNCRPCPSRMAMISGEKVSGLVFDNQQRHWQVTASPLRDREDRLVGVLEIRTPAPEKL